MIQSNFISDILDLLLDGDKDGLLLRKQLPYLTEQEYDYTGAGLFVSFTHSDNIYDFRLTSDITLINGVDIKSSALSIEADATVFIKDGIIDYLEVWSKTGDYPKDELSDYVLTQVWKDSPQRQVTRP